MASRLALKFPKDLKELRLHLCQTSAASKGVRYLKIQTHANLQDNSNIFVISFVVLTARNRKVSLTFSYNQNIIFH